MLKLLGIGTILMVSCGMGEVSNKGECTRFQYDHEMMKKVTAIEHDHEVMKYLLRRYQQLEDTNLETAKMLESQEALIRSLKAEIQAKSNDSSDDIANLQEELKSQRSIIEQLQTTVEKLTAFGSIYNTSVGFKARLRPNPTYGKDQTIVFDEIVSNTGQSYNSATGVFIAPIKGQYMFSTTIFIYNRYVAVMLMKNNQIIGKVHPDGRTGPTFDTASVTSVVDLEKGDQMYTRHERGDGPWPHSIYGGGWTSFTGALIKPYLF